MFSDGYIEVNNQNGNFSLKGFNSKLINEDIVIQAIADKVASGESTSSADYVHTQVR